MPVLRFYPSNEVEFLQGRVNSLFRDLGANAAQANKTGFVPAVDVFEDEHKIVLSLEVPGIKQNDLDVRLENNTLTVRGERKFEAGGQEGSFRRIERRFGNFSRTFSLPTSIDSENVKAEYDSGVLKLELNKRADAKPKQIKIGVAAANSSVSHATEQPQEAKSAA